MEPCNCPTAVGGWISTKFCPGGGATTTEVGCSTSEEDLASMMSFERIIPAAIADTMNAMEYNIMTPRPYIYLERVQCINVHEQ